MENRKNEKPLAEKEVEGKEEERQLKKAKMSQEPQPEDSADTLKKKEEKDAAVVKTITVSAKCSDCCYTQALDADGKVLYSKDGYVPDFMPGKHYGDYVELEIDVNTGKILNWETPDTAKIREDLMDEEHA